MRHPSESDLRLLYAQRKDELIANMKRDEVGTIASPEDYVNCVHCDGEVRQRLWSKHANKCPGLYGKKKGTLSQKQHNNDSRKRFLAKVSPEDSPAMIDLKANMKKDEIGEIALNDPLITKFMAILLDRRYEKMEGVQCSRQQGRNLARLLHHAR